MLQHYGTTFIDSSAAQHKPFFLEVASFSPHTPDTPAPQDVGSFPGLTAPRIPRSTGSRSTRRDGWLDRAPFDQAGIDFINDRFRQRVQSVQSVDRMVGALEEKLASTGQLANTVFVFSSDNGYHDGEHGLYPGKLTAFDTDINVPLIVSGPGIAPGSTNKDLVQNVDLAPTFEELAGATPPPTVEGKSIVPLLHGKHVPWRTLQLVEHEGPDVAPTTRTCRRFRAGNPPTYQAIRSATFTYVHYVERRHRVLQPHHRPVRERQPRADPVRVRAWRSCRAGSPRCTSARAARNAGRQDCRPGSDRGG